METEFIATKASLNRKNIKKAFIATSYEAYKPKAKLKRDLVHDPIEETNSEIKRTEQEIDIKRAKREIIKFGMTGFDAATQEEAKIKLAIKLGAKPQRNKYKNYKELLEEKKKDKLTKLEVLKFQQLGKNNAGKSTAKGKSFDKKRKLKGKNDILDIYGTVKSKDLKNVHKGKHTRNIRKK